MLAAAVDRPLAGVHVVVAGAGLAGLAAARDLEAAGAKVTVFEARARVGGRVHTVREVFAGGQHAEDGADLIEGEQTHVLALARELGIEPVRILRTGWGFYGTGRSGARRIRSAPNTFEEAARRLGQQIGDYELAGKRWDSPIASLYGRTSVSQWLASIDADPDLAAGLRGLRGFFLADPEDLSLLVLVDQFASGDTPGEGRMYRMEGGNDRLPRSMAEALATPVALETIVRRVSQSDGRVRVSIEQRQKMTQVTADYCVCALPATTLRDVKFEPALPDDQQDAIGSLVYGSATRMLLQFARRFWRKAGRPRAFGTDLATGAVWDGNEEQAGPRGILTLLAGGRASAELQALLSAGGPASVLRELAWLGKPSTLVRSTVITWENDPWSRGGYAYFGPSFRPELRSWLSRAAGRVLFAGEHTSDRWQGYMNGAIESGKRAAAEIRALVQLGR